MANQLLFAWNNKVILPESAHQLSFRQINDTTANGLVTKHHYAHRPVPISWAFGAYYDGLIYGVLTIGKPASNNVCEGCCGKDNSERVYELNRLWLKDNAPRNSESRFIGWVLRHLPKGIILVSYADTEQNHLGIIYQATNWIYTGATKERTDIAPTKEGNHSRHYDKAANYPDRVRRSSKHRYVYFTDKSDMRYLKWEEMPYPKRA